MTKPPQNFTGPYVHATAVLIGENGLLIRGRSGAGKSRLARALMEEATRSGQLARLIGDDRIGLELRNGRLLAHPHAALAGQMEFRGQGIGKMAYEQSALLRLVVDITPYDRKANTPPRLPEKNAQHIVLEGVTLDCIHVIEEDAPATSAAAIVAFLKGLQTN